MIFSHDPDATLDYIFDYEEWLGSDILATATFIVSEGLTLESESLTDKTAIAWISGGTIGKRYSMRCRITTAGGRTDDRTATLYVRER